MATAIAPAYPPSRQNRLRQVARALARHGLGWLVLDLGLGRLVPFHRGVLLRGVPEDPAVERDEAAETEVEHEPAQPVPGQRTGDLAEALLPRRRARGRGS